MRLCAVALGLTLAGCATGGPPATFNLVAPASGFEARAPRGVLLVARPVASTPVDGDRIVVRTGADTIAYLKNAQWVQVLPILLQDRLVESFENAHLIRSVVRPGDNIQADSQLVTEIRRFDITAGTGVAHVEVAAKIVDERTGRIEAGRIFSAEERGSAEDPSSATHALNEALDSVLRQIVDWASSQKI
jgi:cholesterol transport system auxiliary component